MLVESKFLSSKNVAANAKDISLSKQEEEKIKDFLQGAVYCWCKIKGEEWFIFKDLMGGDNRNWGETPLQTLFEKSKQINNDDKEAENLAAKNAGILLKKVLIGDTKRCFEIGEISENGMEKKKYRYVPNLDPSNVQSQS